MSDSPNWEPWGIPLIVIGCILFIIIALLVLRWYIRKPMYHGIARIDGKTVVITGANTGIGKETAKDLIKRGARIIILCRDTQKGRIAGETISQESGSPLVEVYQLDLASLESVRACAASLKENEPKIDILINNAGVMLTPKMETKDGFEMQFGTNHLGHFLLTLLLLENIKAAAPSRIINVSSLAHIRGRMHWNDLHMKNNYSSMEAYKQSKLANILFTKSLAEKLKGTGVTTYALHPGIVATKLDRHLVANFGSCFQRVATAVKFSFFKSPKLGAQTSIFCAVDETIAQESGKYYSGCKEKRPSARAQNMEDAERLWEVSIEMVGLQDFTL